MTDLDLLEKRLAFIETCVRELRELARPAELERDVRERRFVERTLQLAIQATLDVASHIVSDERLGEPDTNRALIDLLVGAGWLGEEQREALGNMAGFRNVLVHGYTAVDVAIVRGVLAHHLEDLEGFVTSVRRRLRASGAARR
ncbi:MAG: DUF86 domain-containing protein [Myxococcales bacterium]|nr:DUF86 domain-containing protein [Myxococcales bacterium]